jgi:uncharacterized protein YceK
MSRFSTAPLRAGRPRRVFALVLTVMVLLSPGCIVGSPLAAITGEPYGMTIDDVKALQGRNGRIWSSAPFFAAVDIPFAAVLDTAFLPISLLMWGILTLAGGGDHHSYDDEED